MEKSRLKYQDNLAGYADKWLFFLCFIAGVLAMLTLKQANASQWFVTGLPVFAMCVFAGYVMWNPSFKLRGDKAGDSIYYLGFLFTMVSLAFALREYAPGQGAQVVRNFGVALSTTIAGLVLRVLFHQFREDPLESESLVRADLSEVVRALRDEMLVALRDFGTLRAAVAQSLQEVTESTASTVRAATAAAMAETVETLRLSSVAVSENTKQLAELTESVIADAREVQATIGKHGRTTVKAFEALVIRMEASDLPTERIAVKLNAVAEQFDGIIRKLGDTEQIHESRYRLHQGVLDGIERALVSMKASVDLISSSVASQRTTTEAMGVEWHAAIGVLAKQVAVVADGLEMVDARMRSNASAMNHAVEEELQLAARHRTALEKDLQLVVQHRTALDKEVTACDQLVGRVGTGLIGLSNFIVEKTRA